MSKDAPFRITGLVLWTSRLLMLRDRDTGLLVDLPGLFKQRWLNRHITIVVTDHGIRSPAGVLGTGED